MGKISLAVLGCLLLAGARAVPAQEGFEQVAGKLFDAAVPRDFYLEGNAIPVEKRNAVLLRTPSGARVVVALLDTSGYSSQVQEKYVGMIVAELPLSLGGAPVGVGSYGFGLKKPGAGSGAKAEVILYDQAGARIGAGAAELDVGMKGPVPLQVTLKKGSPARLYLGRYWVGLAAKR
jgi:hypothetical protein